MINQGLNWSITEVFSPFFVNCLLRARSFWWCMQQGDCNAPATFQQLMTIIFQEYIGRFVHVYLDDIFVFSNSIEEHEKHLGLVFDKLRKAQLFLEENKLDLYSKKIDCLGHIIDD